MINWVINSGRGGSSAQPQSVSVCPGERGGGRVREDIVGRSALWRALHNCGAASVWENKRKTVMCAARGHSRVTGVSDGPSQFHMEQKTCIPLGWTIIEKSNGLADGLVRLSGLAFRRPEDGEDISVHFSSLQLSTLHLELEIHFVSVTGCHGCQSSINFAHADHRVDRLIRSVPDQAIVSISTKCLSHPQVKHTRVEIETQSFNFFYVLLRAVSPQASGPAY